MLQHQSTGGNVKVDIRGSQCTGGNVKVDIRGSQYWKCKVD
jgi:hypothetical protein